ncbi:HrpE/YscL family type III secretion apparatus protein [Candidatus Aerophobetes bacterium]|uniref:HrpE/YscL family type III secretion apparatus protein n=1 Tax=Aerophobetes bacterium TaxID=2030807 RepID=A0A2A4WZ66_UNCAE|nr:MAG: HrpE/YscL family type III secretion apparatus protein [Candidatus Aerophobetes bacterium]
MSKKLFSLIYSGQIHTAGKGSIIPKEEYSVLLNAKEVLDKAKEDMCVYLEKNKQTCNALKEKAKEEGFNEGLARFNKHLVWLEKKMQTVDLEMQKQVLSIALQASKKIVSKQLDLNPETIVDIVKNTIKPVLESKEVIIFVSKEDHPTVHQKKEALKTMFGSIKTFSIEEKEDLESGGCIIQTETGIINASLENQWRVLESAFEEFMKK